MRWTPFKQGRVDGLHTKPMKETFKGRKRHDYNNGYRVGIITSYLATLDRNLSDVGIFNRTVGS